MFSFPALPQCRCNAEPKCQYGDCESCLRGGPLIAWMARSVIRCPTDGIDGIQRLSNGSALANWLQPRIRDGCAGGADVYQRGRQRLHGKMGFSARISRWRVGAVSCQRPHQQHHHHDSTLLIIVATPSCTLNNKQQQHINNTITFNTSIAP